ncbi:hypothetical protein ACFZBM_37640 [Streptomyces lavendulae]|uniref:hypothetical protein n=1 Tax=Streptomyces lavendulae TaxID=1914 RepID=UPI0036E2E643
MPTPALHELHAPGQHGWVAAVPFDVPPAAVEQARTRADRDRTEPVRIVREHHAAAAQNQVHTSRLLA